MAYNMKGWGGFQNSPMKQVVPASEHENKKGVEIAKDSDSKAEQINDLQDRIEFLESDIADAGQEGPTKTRAQLMKLKAQLAKLRGN